MVRLIRQSPNQNASETSQNKICKEFLKTTLFKNYFPIESKLLSERSEGGNLSGRMVRLCGESSNQWSEATSAIEACRLRAAKKKTSALPRCFFERKLKMVPLDRLELSHLSVLDFESSASTNSTTGASLRKCAPS